MKSHRFILIPLCALALASTAAFATVGQWVNVKVMGIESSNFRVQSQFWEYLVDAKKVAPNSAKAMRLAKNDKTVSLLLPMDAVISKKKIKHRKHASSGKKGGKK